ncbi:MAG: 3-deoxy-8-phosphooctulonate synthase [Candidatus Zixiibacteriota bacterium]|nr:MAG: 3-deoxy-8-phosphooctulonate synthase [candidate division Zixibacteria bacterium]
MAEKVVNIGGAAVGGEELAIIAGPCAVESEEVVFKAAETVAEIKDKFKLPVIFKSSYMKANRLSGKSFSTIGIGKALSLLQDVKGQFKLPILTDVHTSEEIELAADIADCLQIPAFLCRQTELVVAAAKTGLPINIKKGQFLAPEDMKPISDKVVSAGNVKVLLTERGTSFGYRDLVVDFRGIVIMKEFGFPVVFDCTHSVQKPGASGGSSGGDPRFIAPLARAAVAVGADALFIETHPDPPNALSDKQCQIPTNRLAELVESILEMKK